MEWNLQNTQGSATESEEPEVVDLAGYQVTRAEFFAHTRDPAVTVWENRMKFNMACLRRFPGVTHIHLMIHPEQRRLIVRPCDPDAPHSLRWAVGGGEKEIRNRDMLCQLFAEKLFDLMNWDTRYRYKMLGKPAVDGREALYLFKLSDFELFVNTGKRKTRAYFPEDWRECFGIPVENYEEAYKIDLAQGYLSSEEAGRLL